MLTRRKMLIGAAAVGTTLTGIGAAMPDGFIALTDDGECMTCVMPPGATVVDVRLENGSITQAFYDHNIMDAGDWDFVPVGQDGEPDIEVSIADQVIAWRHIDALT